jgi:hypothetical protein
LKTNEIWIMLHPIKDYAREVKNIFTVIMANYENIFNYVVLVNIMSYLGE